MSTPLSQTAAEQTAAKALAVHKQEPPPFGPGACTCGWRSVRFSWESHVAQQLRQADVLKPDIVR